METWSFHFKHGRQKCNRRDDEAPPKNVKMGLFRDCSFFVPGKKKIWSQNEIMRLQLFRLSAAYKKLLKNCFAELTLQRNFTLFYCIVEASFKQLTL